MLQMLRLRRHAHLMVLNGTVRRLAIRARHPAADHGHRATGLHDLAMDADRGSCIVSGEYENWMK
jgi:hypothetical protein